MTLAIKNPEKLLLFFLKDSFVVGIEACLTVQSRLKAVVLTYDYLSQKLCVSTHSLHL